jgi:hypothetical protein
MTYTDRDLAVIGIFASILPTLAIVYFDWKRRRSDRYSRAKEWLTKCMSHMRGFIYLSVELHNILITNLPPNLDEIESVTVSIAKESHRYFINKAQDLFLSRDSLRQLSTAWDDLSSKSKDMLEDISPFIFDEMELLKVHSILQIYQDGGTLIPSQIKEWEQSNISFTTSLKASVDTLVHLNSEISRRLPFQH